MARPPRKRQHVDDRDTEPPAKKTKTRSETELEAWESWTYPPEFYDRLSEIYLTRRALEEHNRRLRLHLQHQHCSPVPTATERAEDLIQVFPARDLARFARQGGPDLSCLRGLRPTMPRQRSTAMSPSQSSRSRASESTDPASTQPSSATTETSKSRKSTPYNRAFDLHLTEHGIHPAYASQKPDLTEAREAFTVARPSLSPSKFSEGAFEAFQEDNARAKDEADVLANVMPTILGPNQYTQASARNTVFTNLDPLTDGTIAQAKPDIYYGAHPQDLSRPVRDELGNHIMPSTMEDKPLAPNFFVEVKGPNGSAAVATRQVRYDGAIGSRAMHSLQNYREDEPVYDGEAYTYSSAYHGGTGTLQLYAHHPTAPTGEDSVPEYHMTQVRTFGMTDTRDTFIEGATAFRNARDLAKRHRDSFIQAANARASQPRTAVSQDITEGSDPSAYAHEWRNGDDELQQAIADTTGYGIMDDGEASGMPQFPSTDGVSGGPSQGSAALANDSSLAVTSSLTSTSSNSKRPRQDANPPSRSRRSRSSKNPKRSRK